MTTIGLYKAWRNTIILAYNYVRLIGVGTVRRGGILIGFVVDVDRKEAQFYNWTLVL